MVGMKPTTDHGYSVADVVLLASNLSNRECADRLGVTYGAVYQYRKRMGIKAYQIHVFTEDEIEVLREPTSNKDCADKLGLSETQVYAARKHRNITTA